MPLRGHRLLVAASLSFCALICHAVPDAAFGSASPDVRYTASWVVDTNDHHGQPFAIVDKRSARVYVFDATGHLTGASAALLGMAPGDGSVSDIARRLPSSLLPDERTTPAGRFDSQPGRNDKGEDIVWVDYQASLAIHRLRPAPLHERRPARLASASPDDNRISLGCIVLPVAFYEAIVAPTLGTRRGVVYVLPENSSTQAMFGSVDVNLAAH